VAIRLKWKKKGHRQCIYTYENKKAEVLSQKEGKLTKERMIVIYLVACVEH